MDEFPEGTVYYIGDRQFMAKRVKKEIEKVDNRIAETKEELALLETTQNALAEVEDILLKMRELAVLSAEGGSVDRQALNDEFQSLKQKAESVIRDASYKGVNLLDGSFGNLADIIEAIRNAMG